MKTKTIQLLSASAAGAGGWFQTNGRIFTVQGSLQEATDGVVAIECSNDRIGAVELIRFTLDSDTPSDGVVCEESTRWPLIRAKLISATGGNLVASATTVED